MQQDTVAIREAREVAYNVRWLRLYLRDKLKMNIRLRLEEPLQTEVTMKRTMTEVRTFNIKLYCDCGGEMVWNNISLTTNPALYPHVCTDCGKTETLNETYPLSTDVEVGGPQPVVED